MFRPAAALWSMFLSLDFFLLILMLLPHRRLRMGVRLDPRLVRRNVKVLLLPRASLLRLFLYPPLNRDRSFLSCLLFQMLLHNLITRLVTITLAVKRMLLLHARIPVS